MRKYLPKLFQLLALLLCSINLEAQYTPPKRLSDSRTQMGVSAKAIIEFQRSIPNLRFGLNAGLGTSMLGNTVYPALNLEWQIYYRGLGTTSGSPDKKSHLTADIIGSAMVTAGGKYMANKLSDEDLNTRNQPLYYFTEFVQPALQNPFKYSFSMGTMGILAFDKLKSRVQRVGFINGHVDAFQFSYYNDGGGFQSLAALKIGDGEDRHFTGGGFAAVNLNTRYYINQYQISYHKFSGFVKGAFEITSDMNLAYDNYAVPSQAYYNKSFWGFSVGNVASGLSAFMRINNAYNRLDFQNTLHYVRSDSYHHVPYPKYYSIGGSFFNSSTQLGTK